MIPTLNNINEPQEAQKSESLSKTLQNNDLLSRDAFLKLFIEQLKNQDPLNPMKNYELSAQLAQFSQLEQLYDINKNFDVFTKSLNKSSYFQGIGLIGKKVEYEGNKIYKEGDNPVKIRFNLNDDASQVNINIYDGNNNFIKSLELQDLTMGENSATWDGKDVNGNIVPDGIYKIEIIGYNREGEQVGYTCFGFGYVTSLRFDQDSNEALFKVNGEEITIDKIMSISTETENYAQNNETSEISENNDSSESTDNSYNSDISDITESSGENN